MSNAKIVSMIDHAEKRTLADVQVLFDRVILTFNDLARTQERFRLDLDKLRNDFDEHVQEGVPPDANG
jgi:hypothetical protein